MLAKTTRPAWNAHNVTAKAGLVAFQSTFFSTLWVADASKLAGYPLNHYSMCTRQKFVCLFVCLFH